jgi:hypothetical protein
MPCVGFETTIPASERAKTVYASDRSATMTGIVIAITIIIIIIIIIYLLYSVQARSGARPASYPVVPGGSKHRNNFTFTISIF